MDTSEWPLRRLNLFAMPIALAMAIFSNSFWLYLGITAIVGFAIACVMVMPLAWKFRKLGDESSSANPLFKLSQEFRHAREPFLLARYIFMQSLAGGLVNVRPQGIIR